MLDQCSIAGLCALLFFDSLSVATFNMIGVALQRSTLYSLHNSRTRFNISVLFCMLTDGRMSSVVGGEGRGERRARIAVEAHQCSCLTIVDSALTLTGHWAPSAAMKLTHQANGLSSFSFLTFLSRVFSGHVILL
jgi:hypothetical protein